MSRGKVIVVDLDGTLCNTEHREHLAQEKKWDEFHALIPEDSINEDVMVLLDSMRMANRNLGIIILTARPERYRAITRKWLQDFKVEHDILMMRPDHDHSPSEEFKLRALGEAWGNEDGWRKRILFMLEDRDEIVATMRDQGIPCYQVRKGTY